MKYRVSDRNLIPGREAFRIHDTHGIPLEVQAILACQEGLVIGWAEFVDWAERAGWDRNRTIRRCRQACRDAGYNDDVMSKIGTLHNG